ncbi:phytoene/squalene synthase family protein [Sulfitobacter sp. D35]|uniref:15-cis-phytoene synthase n=1 Tax=Sulfitobacter sp. D35 TaxID=3083252 RepID=UPI00296EF801|nr:phytoene/squalene synthase family protein [Sulfitobacter sp. D35]MDW4499426.1 phytoene/squalene synthase family protein [Sulfitobacter sp. D35]
MIDPQDLKHCVDAIRTGSRSFHAASKLLPGTTRDAALALYAFCRLADDAVDLQRAKSDAVRDLQDRLDRAYAGRPRNAPADRAFAAVIEDYAMPRALPAALLEGLQWDAEERRCQSLSDLRAYSARVASAVGAMMCVLMRVRDADALARACDLGVAMQLTNIARDVGEDAREGRLYLPSDWLEAEGIDPDAFLRDPAMSPALARVVRKLLREADALYVRSESGIALLPLACRPGIYAARHIYAGIGGAVRRNGYDSVAHRARTGGAEKLGLIFLATVRAAATSVMPRSARVHAQALPETAFLVEAAAAPRARAQGRAESLLATLEGLKSRDRPRDAALNGGWRKLDHPA